MPFLPSQLNWIQYCNYLIGIVICNKSNCNYSGFYGRCSKLIITIRNQIHCNGIGKMYILAVEKKKKKLNIKN